MANFFPRIRLMTIVYALASRLISPFHSEPSTLRSRSHPAKSYVPQLRNVEFATFLASFGACHESCTAYGVRKTPKPGSQVRCR